MAENTMKLCHYTRTSFGGSDDVTFVELNTTEGEVGIYARHIPMTMIIAPGVLRITEEDGNQESGIIKRICGSHRNNHEYPVKVAEWPEDIDVERKESGKREQERDLGS